MNCNKGSRQKLENGIKMKDILKNITNTVTPTIQDVTISFKKTKMTMAETSFAYVDDIRTHKEKEI